MVFSSSIFLFLFLPLVILGYYLIRDNYRIGFLLLVSLFFYAWGEPKYVLIMLLTIVINYSFGLLISKFIAERKLAKVFLIIAVVCNIGILYYFKYLNFSINSLNRLFNSDLSFHEIALPIGISFFIFQGMSYIIDLYWNKVEVQKNPLKLAFYIAFFPQLMAGPIVRYSDIKDQINKREQSVEIFISGVQRFIIGLSKKVLIANNVGSIVDMIFSTSISDINSGTAWLGIICYSFQIYFDFSGYSDMAIGLGRMFGFNFLENFNYPYISKTLTEFWRRWHISLSSWFRDYVYIPLGGNKKGNVYVNLFIVFAITGFLHGANFQFLAWGLWHGFFLILERLFGLREVKNKKAIFFRYLVTLLIVIIGWVIFRASGLRYAIQYLGVMFGFIRPTDIKLTTFFYLSPKLILVLCFAVISSTPVLKYISNTFQKPINTLAFKCITYILLICLFFISIVYVTASSYNPFIYFRF